MDPLDINLLTFSVQFAFNNNQREVSCALIDQDRRKVLVTEFLDNEHYSTFESIVLQTNPMSATEAKFQVVCLFPELATEREKVKDLFEQCEFEVIEKSKKDFQLASNFESDMNFLLQRQYKHYVQESACAQSCVQAALQHLGLTREQTNQGKFSLEFMGFNKYLKLDLAAINALMIFPKAGIDSRFAASEKQSHKTLVEYLDRCKTAMGQRCLRRWVKMPLQSIDDINKRLRVVEFLCQNVQFRNYLQDDFLKKIPDLDKLYAKFYKVNSQKRHNASLADCLKVYSLVNNIKQFVSYVNKTNVRNADNVLHEVFLEPFVSVLEDFKKFEDMIEKSIDLTKAYQGEYIVNPRFSAKLQELDKQIRKAYQQIENVRQQVSAELNIEVSLSESATYTYIFEANKKQGDEAFRKQGAKRFKTLTVKKGQLTFTVPELQAEVADYVHLKEEYERESKEVIAKILAIVSGYYPAMEQASQQISEIDVLGAFAHVAHSAPREFVKPIITSERVFVLKDSRHPLLEVVDTNCIVNDLEMDHESSRLHVITGPNMGGKSTYIRQVAICALMAHIGCYVPCSYAQVPVLDAIITRVGASDMQLRGISTFMSEMLEASCMLKTATERSLIIIDELGRGTSTSEGFGIAWAIAEHIALDLKPYCLFATHFHEMTLMEEEIPCVKNYYVSCITLDQKITMQYKVLAHIQRQVRAGAVDRSYGLLVAQMLKFPQQVLDDARAKAEELENFEVHLEKGKLEQREGQIEEELQFDDWKQELEYYAKNSTLAQKEAVIQLYQKKLPAQKYKQEVLRILKG